MVHLTPSHMAADRRYQDWITSLPGKQARSHCKITPDPVGIAGMMKLPLEALRNFVRSLCEPQLLTLIAAPLRCTHSMVP